MRILNDISDTKLDSISIFLNEEEMKQMSDYLNQLLNNPNQQHVHLSSSDYQKEITICLYDEKKLEHFHPRAVKLIKEDE